MAAVQKIGLGRWSQVSEQLHPRTDNQVSLWGLNAGQGTGGWWPVAHTSTQCWRRWKKLQQGDLDGYREYVQKNKLEGGFKGDKEDEGESRK